MTDKTLDHLTRQLDLLPPRCLDLPITIIGAGAIGSFTTLALAKMGFEDLTVWDNDVVSVENMSCQFYRFTDITRPKVSALFDLVEAFTKVQINARNATYAPAAGGQDFAAGLLIMAVDSMKARKAIWESYIDNPKAMQCRLIIDPRMGAETALCYAMDPWSAADKATYVKTLYTDDAAIQERCTAKATMYTACMLSGYVAKIVKDFATDTKYPRITTWDIGANAFEAHRAK